MDVLLDEISADAKILILYYVGEALHYAVGIGRCAIEHGMSQTHDRSETVPIVYLGHAVAEFSYEIPNRPENREHINIEFPIIDLFVCIRYMTMDPIGKYVHETVD